MTKLGYTWYPKDWKTNEKVFNMRLELRGFYRELIDFAYENDNKFKINSKYWCRILGVNARKLNKLLTELLTINAIINNSNIYSIPSVEARIQLIRGGKKGGETSKPTPKPKDKPTLKPDSNQREKERETKKEKEIKREALDNLDVKTELLNSHSWHEDVAREFKTTPILIFSKLKSFLNKQKLVGGLDRSLNEVKNHFFNTLEYKSKNNNQPDETTYKAPPTIPNDDPDKIWAEKIKKQAEDKADQERADNKDKPMKSDINKTIKN